MTLKRFERRYERLDDIERKLAQYPAGLTTGYMARLYDVDPSTIHRDIGALERRGTGLIKHGRKWMLDHQRLLYSLKFTNYEIMALFLAARLLSRCSDEQNTHIASALKKLGDAVRTRAPRVARHIDDSAEIVARSQLNPAFMNAFEVIAQAWLEERKVRIRYAAYNTNEQTERIFCPYFVEPTANGFSIYVIGLDEFRGQVRTLKLERMVEAQLTDERYSIPTEVDIGHLLTSAWGIMWADGDDIEVQLHFTARVVRRVKETVWHSSQRIEDLPDGSCLFTIRVGSLLELRPWVRQWGADVEVIAPLELRQELLEEAQAMVGIYSTSP